MTQERVNFFKSYKFKKITNLKSSNYCIISPQRQDQRFSLDADSVGVVTKICKPMWGDRILQLRRQHFFLAIYR
jgi:hypothetical protein